MALVKLSKRTDDTEYWGGFEGMLDDPGDEEFPDEKEKCICVDCYEYSWDKPKCCLCLPYEAGLRLMMIYLIMEFCGTIYLILFKKDETYNF